MSISGLLTRGLRLAGADRAVYQRLVAREPILSVPTPHGPVQFSIPTPMAARRARTLLTKEPGTIAWIESFAPADVLWDVGANVGAYTLYAALRGHQVVAFEPLPANFATLCRNVELNHWADRVAAFCVALNDCTRIDFFNVPSTAPAASLGVFASTTDWEGDEFAPVHQYKMLGFAADDFVDKFSPPLPDHIKLDVDGNEAQILAGAREVLTRVQSVLVEQNPERPDYNARIEAALRKAGLQPEMAAAGRKTENHVWRRHHI